MRVAVQLQNMFVCTLFTSSDYLAGAGLGREVGAMADTFFDQDNPDRGPIITNKVYNSSNTSE